MAAPILFASVTPKSTTRPMHTRVICAIGLAFGATLLSLSPNEKPLAQIDKVCLGRVIDLGITDANNMGAAMAPVSVNIGPSLVRGGLQSTVTRYVEVNLGPYADGIGAGCSLKRRGRTEKRMAAWDGRNLYRVSVGTKGCTKEFQKKGGWRFSARGCA